MSPPDLPHREHRVLVLAPTGRDASNCVAVLGKAGIDCTACRSIADLCAEIGEGAAVVLLTEESLALDKAGALAEVIARQPAWSDLPVVVLTRGGPESSVATRAIATLGNVILLERPLRIFTLVSATRTALRARRKQYQLRAQVAQLRRADTLKDEFLATLAHELRNPLAPIRSGLQVLRLGPTAAVAARTREVMERQVAHMVRLLDDLLDVSRISRGKLELQRAPVELRAVVDSALETCRPLVDAAHHTLTVDLPAAPVLLYADLTRLSQVVSNVLINAARYTPDGGRIALRARCEGREAVVSVSDNGVGIPPALHDQVFEMFAQIDHGSGPALRGLGIGLALVKRLLELHGGSIGLTSPGPGRGSTFTLRLPLADADAPRPAPHRPEAERAGARLRVLVVDDNTDAAHTLATMLTLVGHDARTAHDGPAGLAVAREFHPDVVLLDIGLPGMDGYQVAERLQADASPPVIVALTGWGSERDHQRSKQAGFADHLTKPVDADRLLALLDRLR